jgi:hypothetical protein
MQIIKTGFMRSCTIFVLVYIGNKEQGGSMRSKTFTLLCCVLFAGNMAEALASEVKISQTREKAYLPYLQVGGTGFFNVSRAKGATGADLFLPLWQDDAAKHLLFNHLRVFDRFGKAFEGNIHLGYRYLDSERQHIYGFYGAFDRKRSDYGHYYNQLTFGVESWFNKVFIGANGYCPIGNRGKSVNITNERAYQDRIQNNIWLTKDNKYERVMGGGDAEVGYEFIEGLVGYVGGYYFKGTNTEHLYGPRARLTFDWALENRKILNIFDKLGVEFGVQRDNPRGTTYYTNVNLRIGLSKQTNQLKGVARHMVDLVRRDPDIVTIDNTVQERELLRDSQGKVVKIKVLEGDAEGMITEADFNEALEDPEYGLIAIDGELGELTHAPTITGHKELILGDTLEIRSPYTGKALKVDLGSAREKSGKERKHGISKQATAKLVEHYDVIYDPSNGDAESSPLLVLVPKQKPQPIPEETVEPAKTDVTIVESLIQQEAQEPKETQEPTQEEEQPRKFRTHLEELRSRKLFQQTIVPKTEETGDEKLEVELEPIIEQSISNPDSIVQKVTPKLKMVLITPIAPKTPSNIPVSTTMYHDKDKSNTNEDPTSVQPKEAELSQNEELSPNETAHNNSSSGLILQVGKWCYKHPVRVIAIGSAVAVTSAIILTPTATIVATAAGAIPVATVAYNKLRQQSSRGISKIKGGIATATGAITTWWYQNSDRGSSTDIPMTSAQQELVEHYLKPVVEQTVLRGDPAIMVPISETIYEVTNEMPIVPEAPATLIESTMETLNKFEINPGKIVDTCTNFFKAAFPSLFTVSKEDALNYDDLV